MGKQTRIPQEFQIFFRFGVLIKP